MSRVLDIADVPLVPLTDLQGPSLQLPGIGCSPTVLVPRGEDNMCILLDNGSLLTIEDEVEWWMGRVVHDVKIELDRQSAFAPSWWKLPMLAMLEHEHGLSIVVRKGRRRLLYPWQGHLPANYKAAKGFASWRVYVNRNDEQVFLYAHNRNARPQALQRALFWVLVLGPWLIAMLLITKGLLKSLGQLK